MSTRSEVVLPAPLGPSKPTHLPALDGQVQVRHRHEAVAVLLAKAVDHQRHIRVLSVNRAALPAGPAPGDQDRRDDTDR